MVTTASRQSALERRKALSTAGKAAASRYAKTRQRNISDDRSPKRGRARTVVAATTRPRPAVISQPAAVAPSVPPRAQNLNTRKISNPTRDLALARRRALSRQGKRNDPSQDRIRTAVRRPSRTTPQPAATDRQDASHTCDCQKRRKREAGPLGRPLNLTSPPTGRRSAAEARLKTPKAKKTATSPSRALVLARRLAMSKHGKSANAPTSASSAAVARQGNPELSGRELAQRVRELKARSGSAGQCVKGNNKRPCGPRRGMNRPKDNDQPGQAADAHWKVGASTTPLGQTVTGTRTDRSVKTTGNEASTCRTITGTEY
ncbi:MAG: carboxysome shell protein, partial [Synechococcus sp. SB0669_bin_7]|nr:carboxysome shell protein [Synechococcus sp. SB0669_bin_7]